MIYTHEKGSIHTDDSSDGDFPVSAVLTCTKQHPCILKVVLVKSEGICSLFI